MVSDMTRLPPLESLRIFAVAARHLSFTKAAEELHLTQSAVSHRIKALEESLGVVLFNRLTRRLELTVAGRPFAHTIGRAINQIERGIGELNRTRGARVVTITMLPSVASRWLIPRLTRFRGLHPDVEVQVIADSRLRDLRAEGIDLALRFGRGPYPGYAVTALMPDRVFPVCSPRFAADRIETIDQLFKLPLLHDSTTEGDGSASDWRSWLDHLGRPDVGCSGGQRFSDASLLINAAVSGLGVALARASLVADYMVTGTLVCPLPLATPTAFTYFLLALPEAAALPKIVQFREWLRAEAEATMAETKLFAAKS
jgi:LysR family glycine cleavage system transcriptional activator